MKNETMAFNVSQFTGTVLDFQVNLTGTSQKANSSTTNSNVSPWTVATVVTVLTLITGIFGNGGLLALFALKSSLRSPFNVYLINLLIANLATVVIQYPFDIGNTFTYPDWPFGEFACNLYQYALWILQAGMFNSHQLIALNRLWAVLHPLSYRTRHTIRLAVFFCVTMWLLLHLAILPTMVLDAWYHRKPVATYGCFYDMAGQRAYYLTLQIAVNVWPEIVIWLVLPIVMVAKVVRLRSRRGVMVAAPVPNAADGSNRRPSTKVVMISTSHDASEWQEKKVLPKVRSRPWMLRSNNTLLLVFLTLAISVCWTPLNVFFCWKTFDPLTAITHQTFRGVAFVLFSLQTTIDPIVFVLALPPLRDAIREVITTSTRRA